MVNYQDIYLSHSINVNKVTFNIVFGWLIIPHHIMKKYIFEMKVRLKCQL